MKRAILIATLGLAGTALAFRFEDIDVGKAFKGGAKLTKAAIGVSDADEARIGRETAAYLAARDGLCEEVERTRYVTLVGQTLVAHSPRAGISYHFGILKSREVNAWAAPGGYIFVTEALLALLNNEGELAGVLAHEISHVTERHVVKAMRQANLLEAGQDLAEAAGTGSDRYNELTNFSIDFLNKGFSRGDELEADALGVVLAAKAGYDPQAYRACLKRIGETQPDAPGLIHFHKTHPPAADRLKAVDRALTKNKVSTGGAVLENRFQARLAAVPKK